MKFNALCMSKSNTCILLSSPKGTVDRRHLTGHSCMLILPIEMMASLRKNTISPYWRNKWPYKEGLLACAHGEPVVCFIAGCSLIIRVGLQGEACSHPAMQQAHSVTASISRITSSTSPISCPLLQRRSRMSSSSEPGLGFSPSSLLRWDSM